MDTSYSEIEQLVKTYGPLIQDGFNFKMRTINNAKIFENAIRTFAEGVDISNVIALYDTTISTNGKAGWLFTTAGIYVKESLTKPYYLKYSEIESVTKRSTGKKDCEGSIEVKLKDGSTKEISSVYVNKTPLLQFFREAIRLQKNGGTAKTDKFLIVEDMDECVKYAYISYLIEFANIDDEITTAELNRIYSLMVRIKAEKEIRLKVLHELSDKKDIHVLTDTMLKNSPDSSHKALCISLIKDIIIISGTTYDKMNELQKQFMKDTMRIFSISEDEVKLVQASIDLENKFIRGEIDEKTFTKGMKGIGASAAAIGFPIAAVYLSGSVVGLSAAGITSGLASLGLGGVLGLSSMVTGVGIVVLIGVAAYSGVKWITGRGNKNNENKRDFMLVEAMRKNQEMISILLDDISYLSDEFIELATKDEMNEERLKKMTKKMKLMTGAYKKSQSQNEDFNTQLEIVASAEENKSI